MNPLDWVRTIYGWVGADYPRASLFGAIVLGAVLGGAAWRFAAHVYKTHTEPVSTGTTVNQTTGAQSPIIPDNKGNVTITGGKEQDKAK